MCIYTCVDNLKSTFRLPVSANLGLGDPISYRCIGADLLEAYIIPDFAGTLIQFQASKRSLVQLFLDRSQMVEFYRLQQYP